MLGTWSELGPCLHGKPEECHRLPAGIHSPFWLESPRCPSRRAPFSNASLTDWPGTDPQQMYLPSRVNSAGKEKSPINQELQSGGFGGTCWGRGGAKERDRSTDSRWQPKPVSRVQQPAYELEPGQESRVGETGRVLMARVGALQFQLYYKLQTLMNSLC